MAITREPERRESTRESGGESVKRMRGKVAGESVENKPLRRKTRSVEH